LVLPSIKINRKIGIPMLDRPVFTRENINKLGKLSYPHPHSEEDYIMRDDFEIEDSLDDKLLLDLTKIDKKKHVQVRVLCS
jgi:hypothetical protein